VDSFFVLYHNFVEDRVDICRLHLSLLSSQIYVNADHSEVMKAVEEGKVAAGELSLASTCQNFALY
jgi:hypothetical protein